MRLDYLMVKCINCNGVPCLYLEFNKKLVAVVMGNIADVVDTYNFMCV